MVLLIVSIDCAAAFLASLAIVALVFSVCAGLAESLGREREYNSLVLEAMEEADRLVKVSSGEGGAAEFDLIRQRVLENVLAGEIGGEGRVMEIYLRGKEGTEKIFGGGTGKDCASAERVVVANGVKKVLGVVCCGK